MAIIRAILGALILLTDRLFSPRGIKRDSQLQADIDQQTQNLTLYQYKACPFCVKVRRAMKRHSLAIQTRDAKRCDNSRNELLEGGGKLKVPCLKIETDAGETRWMYESSDIIHYLEQRFAS